ncbi:uncharacterized protein LOC125463662 isoform X2 [Stegostoma tigrinum]|uniref:uncharacterized protein LOC125463662 isoform X2 n=1 Tax=Stegostoma tigrinum TaxID=3053191 RepID=UPI00202B24DC|nr:uncharacterized protein LOC125463662 isoform X2 [Stegostoma tigrinum]
MGSDWRRDRDTVTINYHKYWPVSPSDEKQQEHRHSVLTKKGYFSAFGGVWRNPTIRSNFGVNQLYSNQFQQASYKMLIQQLEELSMMRHDGKFGKLYSPEPDSEEVTKRNSTNHHTKQFSISRSRGYSREVPGKNEREILIISDQEKFKHLSNSLTTLDPLRRVDELSGFCSNMSTLNRDQREIMLESDYHKVESKPIDNFRYSTAPVNIRRNNQNFFFPLWILKPAENKTNYLEIDQSETFPPSCYQRPCLDFRPEVIDPEILSPSSNHEQEANLYPYPDFLPPPFNRIDFSELSMLEDYKWKEALPARPNKPLEQLIDRIVQMEKIQFMTIQKEKGKIAGMLPSTAANISSSRKSSKRSRKSRQCDLLCVQPPHVEVCFKKATPGKLEKRKYLYRIGSSHSCDESPDFQLTNDDVKFKRRLRANCNVYKHFKRSMYSSNQIILSRTASNYANTQAFAAVKSVKPLPGQKASGNSPCKYKKKQKYIQAALGRSAEGRTKHCFLSRESH